MKKYRFIEQSLRTYEVSELCEALGVSRSAYYRWRRGDPSLRQQQDQRHKEAILQLYEKSAGRYGRIERLRKELAKSERINEILKKTVGYFAKEL